MHLCADAGRRDRQVNRLAPITRFKMGIAGGKRRKQAEPVRDNAATGRRALDQAHGALSLQQIESAATDIVIDGSHAANLQADPSSPFLDGFFEDRALPACGNR